MPREEGSQKAGCFEKNGGVGWLCLTIAASTVSNVFNYVFNYIYVTVKVLNLVIIHSNWLI